MDRRAFLAGAVAATACSRRSQPDRVEVVIVPGGVPRITVRGRVLTAGNGGYLIGSCTGADDVNNIWSVGVTGATTSSPACPSHPFVLLAIQGSATRWTLDWTLGPLAAPLKTASVPLDLDRGWITDWRVDPAAPLVRMGCGPLWTPTSARSGPFTAIPQPCTIVGAGPVGQLIADRAAWIEVEGPGVRVRRTRVAGSPIWWSATRHPGTHNVEAGFVGPRSAALPAGTTLRLIETLEVTPT